MIRDTYQQIKSPGFYIARPLYSNARASRRLI